MTDTLTIASKSPEQTARIGSALAGVLMPGDWLALDGPLGAGKTHLIRALAEALGVQPALISSPTFVLLNAYPTAPPDSQHPRPSTTIAHLDAYRLGGSDDLEALGLDAVAPPRIVLIEWADRVADALPPDAGRVALEPTGEASRTVTLSLPDTWRARSGWDQLEVLAQRSDTTCPVTGAPVAADCPTWPFASERARLADLYQWFSGGHRISRPIEQRDLEQE